MRDSYTDVSYPCSDQVLEVFLTLLEIFKKKFKLVDAMNDYKELAKEENNIIDCEELKN